MDRDKIFRDQLKHAHARNSLVDNHRFSLLQLLFTFHGIVLSALIFSPNMPSDLSSKPLLSIWLSAGVGAIGTGVFGVFLSQHRYMLRYKSWIETLEGHLHGVGGSQVADHRGTLYWDKNQSTIRMEGTFLLLVSVFLVLNTGVPIAVAVRLGAANCDIEIMSIVVLSFHALLIAWVAQDQPHNKTGAITPPASPLASGLRNDYYYGNAITDSKDHRGWLISAFMADRNPLLRSSHVEVKWGIHRAGEARSDWDTGNANFSLTILLRGHVVQKFADAEFNLVNEGDLVAWRPGVPHTWRVEKDSVILTIRWPDTLVE